MERKEIIEKVNEILERCLEMDSYEEVKEDDSLKDDLCADSLDVVEIVMNVEREFAITITDEETEKIITAKDLYDIVEKKVK